MAARLGILTAVAHLLMATTGQAQSVVAPSSVEGELAQAADDITTGIKERLSHLDSVPAKALKLCTRAMDLAANTAQVNPGRDRRANYRRAARALSKCSHALTQIEQKSYRASLTNEDIARLARQGVMRIRARVKAVRNTTISAATLSSVEAELDQAMVQLARGKPRRAFARVKAARDLLEEAENVAEL